MSRRIYYALTLLSFAAPFLFVSSGLATPCPVVHVRTPTPADIALHYRRLEEAEKLFQAELEATPESVPSLSGLIYSQLRQGHTDAALETARAAVKRLPKSAMLGGALGEVYFRRGMIPEALAEFDRALKLDICDAPAHFAYSRYLEASSMHASARRQVELARQLSPDDLEIADRWIDYQPVAVQIAALKTELQKDTTPEKEKAEMAKQLERMESSAKSRAEHGPCKVVSTATSMKLPLTHIMRDATHVKALALDVRINDKATARLQLDTGAGGILIRRGIAEKAGLVPILHSTYGGIGDHGEQNSYFALAEDLKIGQFEFHNCPVEVSDSRNLLEQDGLIGGDVFSDYLLTIDLPAQIVEVNPLPPRGGDASAPTLDTAGLDPDSKPYDSYRAPQMKDWTSVLRFDHFLLVPSTLGDHKLHWFILDTGAFTTMLAPETAASVSKVSKNEYVEVRGLSGKVENVQAAKKIDITFAGVHQQLQDAVVVNLKKERQDLGFDVDGLLGFGTLAFLVIEIDYRDGLVHITFDQKHGLNRFSQ